VEEPWLYSANNLARVEPSGPTELVTEVIERPSRRAGLGDLYQLAAVAGTALGAYHGYRRSGSVSWAFGWSLFGGLMPVFAIPLAFAQGFGKKKGKS